MGKPPDRPARSHQDAEARLAGYIAAPAAGADLASMQSERAGELHSELDETGSLFLDVLERHLDRSSVP